jgi:Fe2+ transport system protein B
MFTQSQFLPSEQVIVSTPITEQQRLDINRYDLDQSLVDRQTKDISKILQSLNLEMVELGKYLRNNLAASNQLQKCTKLISEIVDSNLKNEQKKITEKRESVKKLRTSLKKIDSRQSTLKCSVWMRYILLALFIIAIVVIMVFVVQTNTTCD